MPISGDFLNISSRIPSEGALPKAPSTEPLPREMLHTQSPLHPDYSDLNDTKPYIHEICLSVANHMLHFWKGNVVHKTEVYKIHGTMEHWGFREL
jgi:hypothetical protein